MKTWWIPMLAIGCSQVWADTCNPRPVGPELAKKQIGRLIYAGPKFYQTNPQAAGGVGVAAWQCDYQVGNARISMIIDIEPGAPMPCKRMVAFE